MKSPKTVWYCEYCDKIVENTTGKKVVYIAPGSRENFVLNLEGYYCNYLCLIDILNSITRNNNEQK